MTPNTFRVIVGIIILMHVIIVLCMCLYACVPIVEGEVDTGVIPPLLGHSHNGPPRSSTFGKVHLDNATPL